MDNNSRKSNNVLIKSNNKTSNNKVNNKVNNKLKNNDKTSNNLTIFYIITGILVLAYIIYYYQEYFFGSYFTNNSYQVFNDTMKVDENFEVNVEFSEFIGKKEIGFHRLV